MYFLLVLINESNQIIIVNHSNLIIKKMVVLINHNLDIHLVKVILFNDIIIEIILEIL